MMAVGGKVAMWQGGKTSTSTTTRSNESSLPTVNRKFIRLALPDLCQKSASSEFQTIRPWLLIFFFLLVNGNSCLKNSPVLLLTYYKKKEISD